MTRLTSTDHKPFTFKAKIEEGQKHMASTGKISWLHTIADKPGASFDVAIKDSLGRLKLQKLGCKSESLEYGELVNFPTVIGEELEVVVSNIKGAEKVDLFLN